jgi:hypothetical protein
MNELTFTKGFLSTKAIARYRVGLLRDAGSFPEPIIIDHS